MALASWKEMSKIDISKYVKKRDKIDYLSWGDCLRLLYENGAEKVYFEPLINTDGSTLFKSDKQFVAGEKGDRINQCYEVRVRIVIDNLEFVQNYPLINGTNAVYDNSLNSLRVATAQARAFVKGVAIRTGLGISLWTEDEDNDEEIMTLEKSLAYMKKSKLFAQELYTEKIKRELSKEDIAKIFGYDNFDIVKAKFTMFDECKDFMIKLAKL